MRGASGVGQGFAVAGAQSAAVRRRGRGGGRCRARSGARLKAVDPVREAAPQAAKAAQVRDAERELEGDERVVQEEVRLVRQQGLRVVD